MMLKRADTYQAQYAAFRWEIPERINMAVQVCDAPAAQTPDKTAIIDMTSGARRDVSYAQLRALSLRVQAQLETLGARQGDRIGVLLSQSPLCAAAHIAIWRMGAISVPLFKLFQHDALASRLSDSGCALVVTDDEGRAMLAGFDLETLTAQDLPQDDLDLGGASPRAPADTGPQTPAVLIYTSGTTGKPKGALHGHRMLLGHLPGVEISHDFLGQGGDVLWTPADWAWIGGLFDVLMPGLALGVPVVAARAGKFTPEHCAELIAATGITCVFFPPTALRMLKAEGARIGGLRSVASGGEPLGAEMLAWGAEALGVQINEFYGQTECNMVASSCGTLFAPRPGCIGKPVPGFEVAVIDAEGRETEDEGDIAVRRGAASMMLGYWNNPQATADKFRGDWLVMGDRGVREGDFLRFVGRDDDVISSAGYRIGPAEIEDCLMTHPGVATVGVVGKPDALRGEIVKAYVVRKPGLEVTETALRDWVKARLSSYAYPREISFLDALPMTVTGKVIRKELKRRALEETQ